MGKSLSSLVQITLAGNPLCGSAPPGMLFVEAVQSFLASLYRTRYQVFISERGDTREARARWTFLLFCQLTTVFSFSSSHLFSLFIFCFPSLDVTQIQGHKAGSSPPSPLRYVPSF